MKIIVDFFKKMPNNGANIDPVMAKGIYNALKNALKTENVAELSEGDRQRLMSFLVGLESKMKIYVSSENPLQELTKEQVEGLTIRVMLKAGWRNPFNVEEISKLIFDYEIRHTISIEFFLLTCCAESGWGDKVLEEGRTERYRGAGYAQMTNIPMDKYTPNGVYQMFHDFLVDNNVKVGKDGEEFDAKYVSENFPWESAVYYWSKVKKAANNKLPLNEYVVLHMKDDKRDKPGLYLAAESFLTGAVKDGFSSVLEGLRSGQLSEGEYTIIYGGNNGCTIKIATPIEISDDSGEPKTINPGEYTMPNGSHNRAKAYEDYYGIEAIDGSWIDVLNYAIEVSKSKSP